MSTFFGSTRTAANALCGDFKLYPYYNLWFHLDALSSFLCHIMRALYNLFWLALELISLPPLILIPIFWLAIPAQALHTIDSFAALGLSLLTIAVHPVVTFIRTCTSMINGYEEGSSFDCGIGAEEEDLDYAMAI